MDTDTIAIIVAIIGTGIALWRVNAAEFRTIRNDVAGLRERMARLEGLFEGFTRREQETSR